MKIREIARLLGAEVIGDPEAEVHRVSALATARDGDVAFMARPDGALAGFPTCLIAGLDHPEDDRIRSLIRTADPKLTFALVAEILHPPRKRSAEMHPTAVISDSASIGKNVFIGAFVCIGDGSEVGDDAQLRAGARVGDNVRIGQRTVLDPNVFVEDGCTIGNDVILHSGVIIGTDGFGFVRSKDRYVKFPQIGTVVIDDHVEIGANTCIDRGALGETRIGEGTKIDNLVQIGHNVVVGKRVVIAAQTGISGSTVIEDDCVIGGQVGFGDHARVLSGAVIGSQAGILPGKIVRPGVWWGTPIQPLEEYKRQNAHLKGIGRLKNEVREIKRRIADDDK